MKVALVHDYLREYGGAEAVLEALHEIFPEAPIYTAYLNLKTLGPHTQRIKNWDVRTSWLQKIPGANRLLSPFRIFAPLMFESFDLSEYDVVISSCNIYFAKAVITKPETLHLSYIHTPTRYLYGYTTSFNYKKHWWTRIGAEVMNHILRIYDFEISQRPDILVANSKNVADRIQKFYRRDCVVIYPPVDVEVFKKVKREKGEYYLSLCRLWKNKGVDVIIQACQALDLPLKVVGTGPELENLKNLGGGKVEFLGEIAEQEKAKIYAGAKALIVASEDEDFGITAVEAQAGGTPVIAIRSGGYKESIMEGETGEFFDEVTVESLKKTLENFDHKKYRGADCQKQAEKFSKERFKKEILRCIEKNKKVV